MHGWFLSITYREQFQMSTNKLTVTYKAKPAAGCEYRNRYFASYLFITVSEPTTTYKANLLSQDFQSILHLTNSLISILPRTNIGRFANNAPPLTAVSLDDALPDLYREG